ncbi:hypothetical protein NHQ30_004564 [Ciborinia camelliae]|nr:hypothetical protein NHQ30_004564 [Ciborinia camelliae]
MTLLSEPKRSRIYRRLRPKPKLLEMHRIAEAIPDGGATSTYYLQPVLCLTDKLETFFSEVEAFENCFGVSADQIQFNNPQRKWKPIKTDKVVQDKALAAARSLESISLYNRSQLDAGDTINHEHRFWMTYYALVSGVPFIDDYDDLLDAFCESLGNPKPGVHGGKSQYETFALGSIPKPKPSANSEACDYVSLANRAIIALEELLKRIWMGIYSMLSRIQKYRYWLWAGRNTSVKCIYDGIFLRAKSLREDLTICAHFIGKICLVRSVLSLGRMRMHIGGFFWDIMSASNMEGFLKGMNTGGSFRKIMSTPSVEVFPDGMDFEFTPQDQEMDFEWTPQAQVDTESGFSSGVKLNTKGDGKFHSGKFPRRAGKSRFKLVIVP